MSGLMSISDGFRGLAVHVTFWAMICLVGMLATTGKCRATPPFARLR
jgi:hypothetical protein